MKKYNANTYRIYKSDVKEKVEKINPDIEYCKLTKEELLRKRSLDSPLSSKALRLFSHHPSSLCSY